MNDLDKTDKIYSYLTNNKYVQCQTIDKAQSYPNCDFVVLDKFNDGNVNRLSKFELLKNNKPYFLSLSKWEVQNIEMTYKSSTNSRVKMTFIDPLNELRELNERIDYNYDNPVPKENIYVLKHVKNILNEYAKHHNWNEVDLYKENKKLKVEIAKLKVNIKK